MHQFCNLSESMQDYVGLKLEAVGYSNEESYMSKVRGRLMTLL